MLPACANLWARFAVMGWMLIDPPLSVLIILRSAHAVVKDSDTMPKGISRAVSPRRRDRFGIAHRPSPIGGGGGGGGGTPRLRRRAKRGVLADQPGAVR
ncbi:MAG: hypothetical protein ACJAW4_001667 [Paracoccaceae bacterium]